jgi:hypothetical protein
MSKAFLMLSMLAATLSIGSPAMALPKPTDAVESESARPTFSRKQIHDFAAALVEIYRIRQALEIQSGKAPPQAREALATQADTLIAGVIERHGLDQPTFNAISGEVEKNHALRRQIRQLVMEERVGF